MPSATALRTSTLVAVRFPFRHDSLYYRAYSQPLIQQSVLDWALARLCAGAPHGIRIVGVCSTQLERERLTDACRGGGVTFVHRSEADEVHQLAGLMRDQGVARIIELRLGHALAPVARLIRTAVQLHEAVGATLTEVFAKTFPASMFIVDSDAVQALCDAGIPAECATLPDAVTWFRSGQLEPARAAIAAHWLHLEMAEILDIRKERWPERILLENALHVEVLREILQRQPEADQASDHFIDAWKTAAIAVQRAARQRIQGIHDPSVLERADARQRKRVLFVSVSSYFHGAAQSLCHLIEGLDRTRYELFAVVSFEGVLADEIRRRGVTVICPNWTLHAKDSRAVAFTVHLVRDIAPDIVHCNHDISLSLIMAVAAAGVPIVQHVRILGVAGLPLEIQHASRLIAVSELVKRRLSELDVDLDFVDVIRDGIDTQIFHPVPGRRATARQELGIPQDEFVVATIGRMARQKRHEAVVTAVAQLRRETGRGHLLLVASQDGERVYCEEIAALIRREGLVNHHTHIEFTQDVPTVVHATDSLALMSRDEALGRVALEAMAVGRPVVVGDSCGAIELIEHGVNGFVVPHQSVAALTSVLAQLEADPMLAERIGVAAASTVERSASATGCAARVMKTYERVLCRAQRGAILGLAASGLAKNEATE